MKNQYVGDVGDYGKYGLLRYISNKGIHIGVNWYLTEDDDSNDGKFISYLSKESERKYDGELYDFLRTNWGKIFTEEYIKGKNVSNQIVGNQIITLFRNKEQRIQELK